MTIVHNWDDLYEVMDTFDYKEYSIDDLPCLVYHDEQVWLCRDAEAELGENRVYALFDVRSVEDLRSYMLERMMLMLNINREDSLVWDVDAEHARFIATIIWCLDKGQRQICT